MCAPFFAARPATAATLRLSWSSDMEADISGYRLRYGTASGAVDEVVEAGSATSVDVPGLNLGVTYYFSVTAYDRSGNESPPSAELQARLALDRSAPPLVESATEMSSHSVYAVRSIARTILIQGQNFETGATVDLGDGISAQPPTVTAEGDLLVNVNIAADARTGPRSVTVSNPDLGIGTGTDLLSVVKTPDADADCMVDSVDLNALARAWNETRGDARYSSQVDLDGDDYVGPEDLTIFAKYFGHEFAGCP